MKIRSEKGFTGIDISVSVIIAFIFITIISVLVYRVNSTSKEITLKSDATYLAINEIEQVKSQSIEAYTGRSEANGNSVIIENEEITNEPEYADKYEGYYKTITVMDYTDIPGNEWATSDVVKKVTVKISYMFQAKEQSVEISTILSKES